MTILNLSPLPNVTATGLGHLKPLTNHRHITLSNLDIADKDRQKFDHLKKLDKLLIYEPQR